MNYFNINSRNPLIQRLSARILGRDYLDLRGLVIRRITEAQDRGNLELDVDYPIGPDEFKIRTLVFKGLLSYRVSDDEWTGCQVIKDSCVRRKKYGFSVVLQSGCGQRILKCRSLEWVKNEDDETS